MFLIKIRTITKHGIHETEMPHTKKNRRITKPTCIKLYNISTFKTSWHNINQLNMKTTLSYKFVDLYVWHWGQFWNQNTRSLPGQKQAFCAFSTQNNACLWIIHCFALYYSGGVCQNELITICSNINHQTYRNVPLKESVSICHSATTQAIRLMCYWCQKMFHWTAALLYCVF